MNVVPLLCILSKSGKLSYSPPDLLESTVENDSANTSTTFNFLAFPVIFLKYSSYLFGLLAKRNH